MRRLTLVLTLMLAVVGFVSTAQSAVTAAQLRTANVVFDTGVQRPDADRQRLEQSARDLGGQGFRTKFVVVANRVDNIDALARQLRKDVGDSAVEAVLVLGPKQLGVDAKVFDCERRIALDAEFTALQIDDVQGTINVANRLQEFNKAQVLRDSDCKDVGGPTTTSGDGISKGLIAVLVALGLAGLAGVFLARRAAKRAEARRAEAPTAPEDDSPEPH